MRGSRCRRSRSCSSVCPTCLRRMCPPAASSWLRSRTGPLDAWFSDRAAKEDDGAELAPLVAAGGWHEIRLQSPSAKTALTITARITRNPAILLPTAAPDYGIERPYRCKVLGIVLLNRGCGQ